MQVAIAGRTILDDCDNTVQALTDGIGQVPVDESKDVLKVISQRADKFAQGPALARGPGAARQWRLPRLD